MTETPAQWAARTAQEQGLPPKIEDPAALGRLATLVWPAQEDVA